jgi:hypothetical protein
MPFGSGEKLDIQDLNGRKATPTSRQIAPLSRAENKWSSFCSDCSRGDLIAPATQLLAEKIYHLRGRQLFSWKQKSLGADEVINADWSKSRGIMTKPKTESANSSDISIAS